MLAAVLALGGCDRIAQQWPKQPASSVTVKLPPAAARYRRGHGASLGHP